jgi:N-acetylmuramoyl-L-alanine amidase
MKKIALVVGHRASSPGAYGNAGLPEWHFWNAAVSEIVARAEGIPVQLKVFHRKERGGGYTSKMKQLHREIDAWGADISVSLHFNASSHASANGHEVLYCSFSRNGKRYAEIMNNKFTEFLPNKDRGVKPKTKHDRGGGFLCRGRSACILIEPFFASHQNEYIQGGVSRGALIRSMVEFIKEASRG